MEFSSRKPRGLPFVTPQLAPPPGAEPTSGAKAILESWSEYVRAIFPEIVGILRAEGVDWCVETSRAGLQLTVQHRSDRRFGVCLGPFELRGLRGRVYSVRDDARPSDNKEFVDELRRRLGTVGASHEDVYFQRPGFLERPKRGRPRGPLTISRDAY